MPQPDARPIEDALGPEFSFSLWVPEDGDRSQIDFHVNIPTEPSIRRHASHALVYGLALMTLDRQGVITATIDRLLATGPISETDCCNRIAELADLEDEESPDA